MAMDGGGDFVVAWESFGQDGSGWGVYAQRYDRRGVPLGTEFRVNAATAGDQRDPAVAMDDKGDFVVTWESSAGVAGAGPAVYARRYHRNGMPRGGEFRVAAGAADPAIAADDDGDFVIAWHAPDAASALTSIFAQRFDRSGRARGDALRVSSPGHGASDSPAVAMDDDGDFVVAWRRGYSDSPAPEIFARRYTAGGVARGDEFAVTSPFYYLARGVPSVAMDADGDFVVAWSERSAYGSYYFPYYYYYYNVVEAVSARRYTASGVARDADLFIGYGVNPSLAMDADGAFAIAWREESPGGRVGYGRPPPELQVRRYSADAQPQSSSRINATTDGYQQSPVLAMDPDGDFVVVWESFGQDGSGSGVYAQRYAAVPAPPVVPPRGPRRPFADARVLPYPLADQLDDERDPASPTA